MFVIIVIALSLEGCPQQPDPWSLKHLAPHTQNRVIQRRTPRCGSLFPITMLITPETPLSAAIEAAQPEVQPQQQHLEASHRIRHR